MASSGDGTVERVFVVTAIALWLLLSGCASTPAGDPAPDEAMSAAAPVDCTLVEAGSFFLPASAWRAGRSVSDRIRALGYDSSRDVRARTRLENRDGRTRTIVEGWEGIGLRYRDAACRHRVARVGASTD